MGCLCYMNLRKPVNPACGQTQEILSAGAYSVSGGLTYLVFVSFKSQRYVHTSPEKQLDPRGPFASRWGSIPVFLRTPIATCDLPPGGGGGVQSRPPVSPLDPPMPLIWIYAISKAFNNEKSNAHSALFG